LFGSDVVAASSSFVIVSFFLLPLFSRGFVFCIFLLLVLRGDSAIFLCVSSLSSSSSSAISLSLFPARLVHGGLFLFPHLVSCWCESGSCCVLFVPLAAVSSVSAVVVPGVFCIPSPAQSDWVDFSVFRLAACSSEMVCFLRPVSCSGPIAGFRCDAS